MVPQTPVILACLLQLCGTAVALPTQQAPLLLNGPKNVQAVRAKLHSAEIIPTVIDDFLPSLTLSITWPSVHAKLGNTIPPVNLTHQPTVSLHDDTSPDGKHMTSDMSYVLTLTDPDAPSRDNPEWSEMCHWIVANLTTAQQTFSILPIPEFGVSVESEKEGEGEGQDGLEDVVEYKPPGPPPETGKHRYVFLVFAPKNGTTERLRLSRPESRRHWGTGKERGGVREWASMNGLVPVAANFIYSQHEEH
ncbi:Phosphatidylethanolamine-binding protein [Pyrenophora tritici-repentis]|nr:Phosphatidylethanolamine-binding protein [Pyrenophora tritici-repentis]KAF7445805.1 Phosphatidylethanolamine-binding protein [Pyrenophora tritici-repentis]KAI1536365.1 Phospholipid-binding protein [Pyrenophora tritici-repentis]KAI1538732.1 Phospholipid-binding protein [Pyrenophora tritici-repentis]KAI1570570.1 Phospholipid-binding protein [Pyrenophora tritici-repentis]